MSDQTELRCLDPRCATLLPADAELCDECGGTALARLTDADAVLLGETGERPVAFGLATGHPNVLGRSTPGAPTPDIDLGRMAGSDSVHRRHAQLDGDHGRWTVTHLGRNPIVLSRPDGSVVVAPGTTAPLHPGDWLQVGRIRLRFVLGTTLRTDGREYIRQ